MVRGTAPRTAARRTPRRAADPKDERAIAFLHEVLVGDSSWRMSEVRRLAELHTLVALGPWHLDGLDGCAGDSSTG